MPWMMAAGMAASALGGAIGNAASADDRASAKAAQAAALQQILGVSAPTAAQLQVQLQKEQVAGQLSPQQEAALSQQGSGLNGYKANGQDVAAQQQSLAALQQLGKNGMTMQDQANLQGVRNANAQQAQANMKSIMMDQARRGQGQVNSGSEIAAKMMAAQGAQQQNNTDSLNIAGQSQNRALQAIAQAGQLGGQMRGQDFSEASQKAAAQDAINRFNTQNQQGVLQRNTNAANAAQEYNLNNAQAVSNANTGIANQNSLYNSNAIQQAYGDKIGQAQSAAGQYNTNAQGDLQRAQQTAGMWSNIGQGAGNMMGAYGMGQMMQQAPKNGTAGSVDSSTMSDTNYGTQGATPWNKVQKMWS